MLLALLDDDFCGVVWTQGQTIIFMGITQE
jgi:hypothetical protein